MHWKLQLQELVETRDFATQGQLVCALQERGCEVNQGTISRELTRAKIRKIDGFYRHPTQSSAAGSSIDSISVTSDGTLCVIRTKPAFANVIAQIIDERADETVLGTVAGDDTVFVATIGIDGLHHLEELLKVKSN